MDDETEKRKEEHILRSLENESQYVESAGFDDVMLLHNSLPEVDYGKISTEVEAWGRRFSLPFMITGMTGGYKNAERINKDLALAAEEWNIPLGLGSQRAMVERPGLTSTYAVKEEAPGVFLIGNIGAYQLKEYSPEKVEGIVSKVELDALAIHLNPLQEMIQPEGDKDWSGVLEAIERHVEAIDVPVIVKETGAGLSPSVVDRLREIGIEWFDVSGKGGTSWSKIEYMRGGSIPGFEEWGIPTVLSLLLCRGKGKLIASGGIRSGIDGAKAIAIGAEMFGAARPFLLAQQQGRLNEFIKQWAEQVRGVMFLTGAKNVQELKEKEWMMTRKLFELHQSSRCSSRFSKPACHHD